MSDAAPAPTPSDAAASFCAALVDEWVRAGVRHAVVSPGSRSTPMALALAARDDLALHVFHDERSASFAALGMGAFSGVPAVLLCTSGTAAAHFHAAVVEAHQSDVPMIVCTADRPPELRDVGAPQTIDQTNLYGGAVRWFHDPGVAAIEAAHTWRSLAARAFHAATGERPGPVHLNLPFREPLLGEARVLPVSRGSAWSTAIRPSTPRVGDLDAVAALIDGRRGVIVAGRGASSSVLDLARALRWPVFADALSGLRVVDECVVAGFDPLLRCQPFATDSVPEVVMRVGAPPASKVLAQWVGSSGALVIQVSASAMVVDPDHRVAMNVSGDIGAVCATLAGSVSPAPAEWCERWTRAARAVQVAVEGALRDEFCEPSVARAVTAAMAEGENLVVSSSMPIRDVEWFGSVMPGAFVHANRGTNGIDGVVSTAVGVALASGCRTRLLIGDIAMVHDSNGLWALRDRGVSLTMVVVNNDGGSIFSFLPQATSVRRETFESLFGTPHGVDFSMLAAAHGVEHVRVGSIVELEAALRHDGVRIVEVPFARELNVAAHDRVNARVAEMVAGLGD